MSALSDTGEGGKAVEPLPCLTGRTILPNPVSAGRRDAPGAGVIERRPPEPPYHPARNAAAASGSGGLHGRTVAIRRLQTCLQPTSTTLLESVGLGHPKLASVDATRASWDGLIKQRSSECVQRLDCPRAETGRAILWTSELFPSFSSGLDAQRSTPER